MILNATNFNTIRRFYGLTQEKTAALLGVHQTYIAHIEKNRVPLTRSIAAKLTQAFDLTPEKIDAIVEADAAHKRLQALLGR